MCAYQQSCSFVPARGYPGDNGAGVAMCSGDSCRLELKMDCNHELFSKARMRGTQMLLTTALVFQRVGTRQR